MTITKVYRRHPCTVVHRTPATMAKCMFPRAEWIHGEGPYAVLAWCRVLTVTLWPTMHEAEAAREMIDRTGCGGRCRRRHEIVGIELPARSA